MNKVKSCNACKRPKIVNQHISNSTIFHKFDLEHKGILIKLNLPGEKLEWYVQDEVSGKKYRIKMEEL